MRILTCSIIVFSLVTAVVSQVSAVTSQEVLVVYNANHSTPNDQPNFDVASKTVAEYYAAARLIPETNIIGIQQSPYKGYATESEYTSYIAAPIYDYLSSHPNIKAIVLCYGIPSSITYLDTNWVTRAASLDAALCLLGNPGTPTARTWALGLTNPYYGKNVDFSAFRDSPDNHITGPGGATWKLRYLVTRLDGQSSPTVSVNGVDIPRDIKDMIDRSVNATPGGKYIIDDWPNDDRYQGNATKNALISAGVDSSSIVADYTSTFLTNQTDVLCYVGEHMTQGGNANNYTTWCRPFNSWHFGGVALPSTEQSYSFNTPMYVQGSVIRLDAAATPEPNKLKVTHMWKGINPNTNTDPYATHQLVICDANGNILHYTNNQECRSTLSQGSAAIATSDIVLPPDNRTYLELRFPLDDPMFGDQSIRQSRTEFTPNASGLVYTCLLPDTTSCLGRISYSAFIAEGASGAIACVLEPGVAGLAAPKYVYPRYASGYTWAESAYMGISFTSWQDVVLGDPLMAPNAAHPVIDFQAPSPAADTHVAGQVTLNASAQVQGTGTIERVEFWLDNGQSRTLLNTISQPPFVCNWNTLAASGGSQVYPDGDYTIQATVYQTGSTLNTIGCATTQRHVIVDNATVPAIIITQPQTDDLQVSVADPVVAQPGQTPSSVEFWLFEPDGLSMAAQLSAAPYEWPQQGSVQSNGVYEIQAIAHYANPSSVSYATPRRIVLANNSIFTTRLGDLASIADGEDVALVNVPVVAGVSSAMDGAFYVEDPLRAAGIRVETTDTSIQQGSLVTVFGSLHKSGDALAERCITATRVCAMGNAVVPRPLGLPIKSIGGKPPDDAVGVTEAKGLCNTGLLVRIWGRVSYVGDDFVYVDDGSGSTVETDGSGLKYYPVPLDGSTIPQNGVDVTGTKVCFGNLAKPKIGDYVAVDGISSCTPINGKRARCIRAVRQADPIITYPPCYLCRHHMMDFYFGDASGNRYEVGDMVRIATGSVESNDGACFTAWCSAPSWDVAVEFDATTALDSTYSNLVIIGKVTANDFPNHFSIAPEGIYQGAVGDTGIGLLSFSHGSCPPPAPYNPWPTPSISEILASAALQAKYNEVGAIGWALSQPDGTVVDLRAESICGEWYSGRVLGLREWFEPAPNGPNLFLYLDKPVELSQHFVDVVTIDIVGATLTTLGDGRRALIRPQGVYVYTDAVGRWVPPMPWLKDGGDSEAAARGTSSEWPWKRLVAP